MQEAAELREWLELLLALTIFLYSIHRNGR